MAAVLESVQLALFPGAATSIGPDAISKALFDQAPERIEVRPAEGVQVAQLQHPQGAVQISVNPLRVDLQFQAAPSPTLGGGHVVGTADVESIFNWVKDAAPKMLAVVGNVQRVGVVVVRSEDFVSSEAGSAGFAKALPDGVTLPQDVSDPSVQFNRKFHSNVVGRPFNVMSAWQLVTRQDFSFVNGVFNQTIRYSVRTMVDANTPQNETWPAEVLSSESANEFVLELIRTSFNEA